MTEVWPIKCEQKYSTSILVLIHKPFTQFLMLSLLLSVRETFIPSMTLEAPHAKLVLICLHGAELHPILSP